MNKIRSLHNLLAPLISTNTISADISSLDHSNKAGCEVLANYLEELNFNCALQQVDMHKDKWNLIATYCPDKVSHSGIMFSGHIDTVSANASLWQEDPMVLSQQDETFVGLGVTDMKGFYIAALESIRSSELKRTPITVIATSDEETSMAGARVLKELDLPIPKLNIIGEPTNMHPVMSHKGYVAYQLTIFGKGGHSSLNHNNQSGLEACVDAAQSLMRLKEKLQALSQDDSFSVPSTTLNLGMCHAGSAVNRICDEATLSFDIRPLPSVPFEQLLAWVKQSIESSLIRHNVTYQLTPMVDPVRSFHSTLPEETVSKIIQCCNKPTSTANYVTEAPFFESMGIPSVILGPGDIHQAHQANESISIASLMQAENCYRSLIEQYSSS